VIPGVYSFIHLFVDFLAGLNEKLGSRTDLVIIF